jgi:hypothetical protein
MRDIYIASDYIAYDIYRVKRRFVMAISFNSIKITEGLISRDLIACDEYNQHFRLLSSVYDKIVYN